MKYSFKRFFSLLLVITSFLFISVAEIRAVSVAPSTGTYGYGSQITLTISATDVVSGQTAVNLDLTFTNATVISYTPPGGVSWSTFLSGTPQCNGTSLYSSTKICAALAKNTDTIVAGESLGSVTIRFDKLTGTSTVFKTGDNIYINGDTDASEVDEGDLATFTISGTIPITSLKDPVGRYIAFAGVLLVIVGIMLYRFKVKTN